MGVAQKTTFSNLESLKKFFGVSGDLMEYNERGKPVKRLSSPTNPKSADLYWLIMPKYGNSAPDPQKWNFSKLFSFLWKGLQISLPTSPQPPPDIKSKSSYARKRDFGLLYPNMEI